MMSTTQRCVRVRVRGTYQQPLDRQPILAVDAMILDTRNGPRPFRWHIE